VAAGQASDGIVAVFGANHRADQRQLVHHFGESRQMLADLDSRDGGGNRSELAADFRRRVHLEIENVLMRRPAGQEIMMTALCERRMPDCASA